VSKCAFGAPAMQQVIVSVPDDVTNTIVLVQ
jgi:hypothetical protein